jgi:hypothetical protein
VQRRNFSIPARYRQKCANVSQQVQKGILFVILEVLVVLD